MQIPLRLFLLHIRKFYASLRQLLWNSLSPSSSLIIAIHFQSCLLTRRIWTFAGVYMYDCRWSECFFPIVVSSERSEFLISSTINSATKQVSQASPEIWDFCSDEADKRWCVCFWVSIQTPSFGLFSTRIVSFFHFTWESTRISSVALTEVFNFLTSISFFKSFVSLGTCNCKPLMVLSFLYRNSTCWFRFDCSV